VNVGIVADFYYPWIGGPAAAIRTLAAGLTERGHTVSLLVPSPDGPGRRELDGQIEVTRASSIAVPFGYRLRAAVPSSRVAAWFDRTQPDLIHVHHPFPLSAASVLLARRRGIPVVATNHTIPACSLWGIRHLGPVHAGACRGLGAWITWLLSRCDAVTAPTATAARLTRECGFERPIAVISNGIDTGRFSPGAPDASLRERFALDARPVVLYTGRLDAEKEMTTWLQTAARLAQRTDVQLVIGGEGADRPRLETLVRGLGLERRARFIGYVPDSELPQLYRLADVYLITSPVELQSISTLEAMASGVPIVAVDAGALPELVRDGLNGYLVIPGNWEGAARAVMKVLEDENLRRSMSRQSRDLALEHSIGFTIDAYERLFEQTAIRARGDRRLEQLSAAG
jgi:glycosyltransferase involved in cell wall biosynthesis